MLIDLFGGLCLAWCCTSLVPRPPPFLFSSVFPTLPLWCIILSEIEEQKMGEAWEQG